MWQLVAKHGVGKKAISCNDNRYGKKNLWGAGGGGFAQSILLLLFLFKDLVQGLKHGLRLLLH
jgi:hypothetical protein